jgi:ankyrin repeat protein
VKIFFRPAVLEITNEKSSMTEPILAWFLSAKEGRCDELPGNFVLASNLSFIKNQSAEILRLIGGKVDAEDEFGNTALIYAAGGNHLDSVEFLLQAKADRNRINHQGETALHKVFNTVKY